MGVLMVLDDAYFVLFTTFHYFPFVFFYFVAEAVIPPVVLIFRLRSASPANVPHMSVVGPSRRASALS